MSKNEQRPVPVVTGEAWWRKIAAERGNEIADLRQQVIRLEATLELLRNEIKAVRNTEDYDPAPIIVEYDRVVEERDRLRAQRDSYGALGDWLERSHTELWVIINAASAFVAKVEASNPPTLIDGPAVRDEYAVLAAAVRRHEPATSKGPGS